MQLCISLLSFMIYQLLDSSGKKYQRRAKTKILLKAPLNRLTNNLIKNYCRRIQHSQEFKDPGLILEHF